MGPEYIMTPTNSFEKPVLRAVLDEIIHTHGFWPVLRALLTRRFRRRYAAMADPPLSNHIRRDIGLRPVAPFDPWSPHRR